MTETRDRQPKKDPNPMARSAIQVPGALRVVRGAVAGLLVLALAAGARAQSDELEQKDGKKVSGTVQVAVYDHVELKTKQGAKQNVEWDKVAKLKFGGSVEFTEVVDKIGSASIDDSLAGLEKLRGDEKLRPVLKQEVLFLLASLKGRRGDFDGSVAGWQELLKAFPAGRYLDQAVRGGVEALLASGKAPEAQKFLDQAAAEAKAANPGPRFDLSVALLKGRILEAQNSWKESGGVFAGVEKAGNLAPDQAAIASLGIARSQQMLGQTAEAEVRYRKIATSPDAPRYVVAGAWNGIGDLYAKTGRDKRDNDQLTLALYCYLRGVTYLQPLEGEPTAEHMRALDSAAQVYDSMGQIDGEKKQAYNKKASDLRDQRKRQYGSPSK
jgi:tetratricopeptide (TPR) repeat protein